MKKLTAIGLLFALFMTSNLSAQMSGGNAFMIGDFVEIGISGAGYEGAIVDSLIPTHHRGTDKLGFVANPNEDGWVEYNGDFYQPGLPESGFGLYLDGIDYGNNAVGLYQIPGEITSFSETADSVIVEWLGMVDSVTLGIVYELKKDEHFYTTSISIDNIGSEPISEAYYYRSLDPDNNQTLGWGFGTTNTIESQSEMMDDSVIVSATQEDVWTCDLIFHAYGPEWKGFIGGFSNRNAYDMWHGYAGLDTTEGASAIADQAMGLSYQIGALLPGRAGSDTFSFATAFKREISFGEEPGTSHLVKNEELDYQVFPNPTTDNMVQIQLKGTFDYRLVDLKGSQVLNGQGYNLTQLDLQELDNGIYFLEIRQANKLATEKLILR